MKKLIYTTLVALTAVACAPGSKLKTATRLEADQAFAEARYADAMLKYNSLLALNVAPDSAMCRNMTIASARTKDYPTATKYGALCKMTAEDTLLLFAYGESLDSLGREAESVALIEARMSQFELHYGRQAVVSKLARHYSATEDLRLEELFAELELQADKSACFDAYFAMIEKKKTPTELRKLCNSALRSNALQKSALHYLATTKYEDAESQYKQTMAEYNKKKNATTYAYLRRDLKRVSAVYRESKDHFETLRKLEPDNKNYVKYLININLRLDQKDKAKELEKLL